MKNEEIIAEVKAKYNLLNVNEPIWNDLIEKSRTSGWNDAIDAIDIDFIGIETKSELEEKKKKLKKAV